MKKRNGILSDVSDADLELLTSNPAKFWEGVTKIGYEAFRGCTSLTNITIPNSVTKIGEYAFFSCRSLTNITIPNSVTSIEYGAFNSCTSLTNITIPNSVTEIGYGAFRGCTSLTNITIPNSVTEIEYGAFNSCTSLTNITIPNSVTKIGGYAFYGCTSLTDITIPNSVTSINDYAFSDCTSLIDVTIPNSVTKIGYEAFRGCTSLTDITIPNSVTKIEYEAFRGCTSLTDITIPNSVAEIGKHAFDGCESLNKITFKTRDGEIKVSKLMVELIPDTSALKFFAKHNQTDRFNDLKNKLKVKNDNANLQEMLKLGISLGLCEKDNVKISKGKNNLGQENFVKVSDIAYELMQRLLITQKQIDFKELHMKLSGMKYEKYNEAFLRFFANKNNTSDIINNLEMLPRIYDWFVARTNLQISDNVQIPGDRPTIEANRFKIYHYSDRGDGVYKDRWSAVTVELIKKELASKKYIIQDESKRHIAEELSEHSDYKDQKFFDKAVEIDNERIKNKVSDHILSKHLKQDVLEALREYDKQTTKLEKQIRDDSEKTLSNQVDIMNEIFTYEMLSKSSAENFTIGLNTSCCAKLFGAGAGAQRASIIHPDLQNLVIRDKRGNIVAFGIIYVNRKQGYAVVNDIEVNNKYSGKDKLRERIYEKVKQAIENFVALYNKENLNKPLTKVTCGLSPNWTAINDFIKENPESSILKVINFDEYKYAGQGYWAGDWQEAQYTLWQNEQNVEM